MGLIKSLKKLKLKKLQPGKLIKNIVGAAAAIGVPGAGAVNAAVTRVGQRVDDAKRVADKAKAEVERIAREQGISTGEAADQLAGRAIAGAEAGLMGLSVSQAAGPLLLLGGALLLLFMWRKR